MSYLLTSESVSEGHPDKVADQISDTILDLFLTKNERARVAVETLVTQGKVILAGEVSAENLPSNEEIEALVRHRIAKIGYTEEDFNPKTVSIENFLHAQSADIALGVDKGGAGDQGVMFGYATNEWEGTEYMPPALYYAHQILKTLAQKRHSGELKGILPDAKSQITLIYEDGRPIGTDTIVVSTQHKEEVSLKEVREMILPVLKEVLPPILMPEEEKVLINPTGRFVIGGPAGDTGLTGRKIIVDTYGGAAPHGGGAFSGKDPTKVDRSAAYMARYLAKNLVASGVCDKCLVGLSYAIGVAEPVSVNVQTFGTAQISDEEITEALNFYADLTPNGIIEKLDLWRPIYTQTASYGHFGRKPENGLFPWEELDLVPLIEGKI